jgi:hypothetical protein
MQRIIYIAKYGKIFVVEMSPEKSETIAFVGKNPVRRKIIVDNICLQQVKNFKCLGCKISYENKKEIQQQLAKFAQTLGILNNIFRQASIFKNKRT